MCHFAGYSNPNMYFWINTFEYPRCDLRGTYLAIWIAKAQEKYL